MADKVTFLLASDQAAFGIVGWSEKENLILYFLPVLRRAQPTPNHLQYPSYPVV